MSISSPPHPKRGHTHPLSADYASHTVSTTSARIAHNACCLQCTSDTDTGAGALVTQFVHAMTPSTRGNVVNPPSSRRLFPVRSSPRRSYQLKAVRAVVRFDILLN